MTGTKIDIERAAQLWAVLGAPLVGVPLMIVLLALSAPAQPAPEAEADTEPVEVQAVERTLEARLDCEAEPTRNG